MCTTTGSVEPERDSSGTKLSILSSPLNQEKVEASPPSSPPPFRLLPRVPPSTLTTGPAYKLPKFLRALYAILATEDPSIIKWIQNQELRPHQVTAFHILHISQFEQRILPKYFKHAKFASFQRQLNNFGFRKWTKTQSSGVCTFSHNSFPPDPKQIGILRPSVRDLWKKKQTDGTTHRRRVGNGITIAERKLQEAVQQQQQRVIPKPLESFSNMFKTTTRMQVKCRNPTLWSSNRPLYNNTINIGTYHGPTITTVPYEGSSLMKSTMDVSLLPIEPWSWTTAPSNGHLPPLEMPPLYTPEGLPESVYNGGQRQHQISPCSTEEFTFDHWMLFVE